MNHHKSISKHYINHNRFLIGVATIKSKSMLVTSIPNKPTKDTKTKECVKSKLVIEKPIRQFRIKEGIGI